MIRTRPRRRGQAHLLADLDDLLKPGPRITVPGVVWRWRYELALAACLAVAAATLLCTLGGEWTVICVSALAGMASPPWPEPVSAAAWRIITPHRLRSGFAQARIQSRRGRLPFVLRTTSEPFGERAHVWCPAGTSAEDLRSARALLRAACWAADVRIIPDERHRHLATIDVIRWASPDGPGLLPAPGTGGAVPAAPRTPAPAP